MCSLFKYYNITPIFIFDGKPPDCKKEELERRKKDREESEKKLIELQEKFGNNVTKEQAAVLNNLKRATTKINWEDIELVKRLFDSYGIKYMTANGEADVLCASLVLKKKVYAVLTEDMDLFAYTCPVVLRYFSLANHTCILYDLSKILKKLDINKENFRILCVLSGNDYYSNNNNIFYYLKLYNRFKKLKLKSNFLAWLVSQKYVNKDEIDEINARINMYLNIFV